MGHGVRSALVTTMVRGLVEELKTVATDPGQLLTKVNGDLRTILQQTGTPLFTTAFYLVIDLEAREFLFANAGHPKPFMIRGDSGEVEVLRSLDGKSRPALGLFQESVYPTTRLPVRPGDRFMLFTDGLFEVPGPDNTEYSQEMLLAAVKRLSKSPAVELFDQLLAEIKAFALEPKFDDDVCLVAVDVSPRWPAA
jgi:sigma-B regulation protein RsbU (phosphoserine phosphatase)